MNKQKFQELLSDPGNIKEQDIVQLQQVIKDYPYFHNAHFILLYSLYHQKSEKFKEQLKYSSLYLSDRTALINAITEGWTSASEIKLFQPREITLNPVVESLPDKEVAAKELEIETSALKEVSQSKDVDREKDIMFEENFSFSLEESQPIEITDKAESDIPGKLELNSELLEFDEPEEEIGGDLIDHFLKVNPRIVPKLDIEDKRGDISIPGLEENDEIVTETLAEIYEQQGHFLKAKDAYQKLILKFPEKSTYFASRIQEIEKRLNN